MVTVSPRIQENCACDCCGLDPTFPCPRLPTHASNALGVGAEAWVHPVRVAK